MKKKHLTEYQRYEIYTYLQSGMSQRKIAQILGFNRSTISHEIKRNSDDRNRTYKPDLAQRKYRNRMSCRAHYEKFTDSLKLQVDILLNKSRFQPGTDKWLSQV